MNILEKYLNKDGEFQCNSQEEIQSFHLAIADYVLENEEKKMCWNDIRLKLPEEDENCLVMNVNEYSEFAMHRAYFTDGFFLSNETSHSFPLLITHWMSLPKVETAE